MTLEQRVTALEKEIAELKRQLEERPDKTINVVINTKRDITKDDITEISSKIRESILMFSKRKPNNLVCE